MCLPLRQNEISRHFNLSKKNPKYKHTTRRVHTVELQVSLKIKYYSEASTVFHSKIRNQPTTKNSLQEQILTFDLKNSGVIQWTDDELEKNIFF